MPESQMMSNLSRYATYAWGVLAYNLLVVLWGAFVRATGSGAGCGSHWPLCNGAVVPRDAGVETMIEFTHRLTSGVALLAVVGLLVWARRAYPAGHPVRLGAKLSMGFMVLEALVGAGLVLLELVADNASLARAYWMVVHLVNTLLLVGSLALTAWWASGGAAVRLRGQGVVGAALGLGVVGMLLLAASGAVAALGDTLFPARSLAEGLRADFDSGAHFLLRLRILHPVIAVGLGLYLVLTARFINGLRPSPATRRLAQLLTVSFLLQLVAGVANVALLAPVWMQLVHLLLADFVWISLVLLGAATLSVEARDAVPAAAGARMAAAR